MTPKSNLGRLGAIFSAVLILMCLGVGYVVFAAAGTFSRYTKELNVAEPGRSNWAHAVRTKSEMPPAAFVPVQSMDAKNLAVGKLLVASRNLVDPSFARTVILLVHRDDQGLVGLILNRRTDIALSRVLEGVPGAKNRSDTAYLGGPVEVPAVFGLLKSPTKVEGADQIFSGVYLISTKSLFEQTLAAGPDPQVFHVYLGYAGWANDQLRREVELGSWFIFPADAGAVFNSDPGSLWPQMIRQTERKIAGSEPTSADPFATVATRRFMHEPLEPFEGGARIRR